MNATVGRGYRWWCACNAPLDASYNDYILDETFEVVKAIERQGEPGYTLKDCDGVVHPFVPADLVTLVQ